MVAGKGWAIPHQDCICQHLPNAENSISQLSTTPTLSCYVTPVLIIRLMKLLLTHAQNSGLQHLFRKKKIRKTAMQWGERVCGDDVNVSAAGSGAVSEPTKPLKTHLHTHSLVHTHTHTCSWPRHPLLHWLTLRPARVSVIVGHVGWFDPLSVKNADTTCADHLSDVCLHLSTLLVDQCNILTGSG